MRAIRVLVAVLCSAFGVAVLAAQGFAAVQASQDDLGQSPQVSALDDPWH